MGNAAKSTILVTGGAGYIGSHTVKALQPAGHHVVVVDNLVYGHRDIVEQVLKVELQVGDIGDRAFLDSIFSTYAIEAVIHFAAYAYVGESVTDPAKYYQNNVAGTLNLLMAMRAASVNKLVFSSTCATYGVPDSLPITETHLQRPINPYGKSKLMVEQMLSDFDTAYGIKSVIFRYFNAAGADLSGQLGEDHTPETHLIPLVLQTALGQREAVSIFGTDYPTADGTCVRDYLHVSDLASAHILGLEFLLAKGDSQIFNLSNGNGISVRALIETAKAVTHRPIKVIEEARRVGDPAVLIGSSDKAFQILGWKPQYPDLEDIVAHAWQWHQQRHNPANLPLTPVTDAPPLVSVIIPTYNAEAFVAQTLASVLAQTHPRVEILVVDDGSCDRTASIVKAIAQQHAHITLLQQSNGGVAAARNAGLKRAKGEFVAPIDADDLWDPEMLEKLLLPFYKSGRHLGIVYTWSVDIDAQGNSIGGFHAANNRGNVYKTLICHNFLGNASATLIRKECFDKIGGYSTELRAQNAQGCEDWDLYLRLAAQYEFDVVPEFLVGYRKGSYSMSADFNQMARSQRAMLQAVEQRSNLPSYLYRLSYSSFYLYLAQQSNQCNDFKGTLFWLRQAITVDPITPLCRPGFYLLLIKNLAKKFGSARKLVELAVDTQVTATPLKPSRQPSPIPLLKASRPSVWLKLLVESVFHFSLSKI